MATEEPSTSAQPVPASTPTPTPDTPLSKFNVSLPGILESTMHKEMWGIELQEQASHIPTQVVLQKFLRANNNDVSLAEKQLTSALEWRKKYQPTALIDQVFDKVKFGGLGYVSVHPDSNGKETVITWNIYGAVKDNQATFGNIEEFIKWRAALMELGVQQLKLNEITELIPDGGPDPYQAIQVHDYKSVSFFRLDPVVKAASKETIQTFSMAYPELLAHKYFVNVPAIMGWMYGAMKLFLAPATLKKFHPMTSGTTLGAELKGIAASLPTEYGGQADDTRETLSIKVADLLEPAKMEIPVTSGEAPVAVVKEAPIPTDTAMPATETGSASTADEQKTLKT